MLLDFFATFFSSATALLPIFAQDVLHVGPRGYGWLYAAPAIGAVLASAVMVPVTHTLKRRGQTLLWAVVVYGLSTVVVGFSRSFWLTMACLALSGAADAVSMIIRNIVRQLETPDAIRGRVSAVNSMFIGASNELGAFRAGIQAAWVGIIPSMIWGGVCTLAVVGSYLGLFPQLRKLDRFPEPVH
jgi:MFS family permease